MQDKIIIRGAREHNLKNISLELPRNKFIVFTGLSGSGKSSLAFDTIFAEGQRRYVESLSAYARQFLGQMDKPDVDEIEGLSPAISIDQKAHSSNPRSTVATITEIYDYLRVLYARVGHPHCILCGDPISRLTTEEMVNLVVQRISSQGSPSTNSGSILDKVTVLAPVVVGRKGEYHQMLYDFYNQGFAEARINGVMKKLRERVVLARYKAHDIDLVVDKVPIGWPIENNKAFRAHLAEAIESGLKFGHDVVKIGVGDEEMTMSSKFACPKDGFSFPEIEPRLFSFNSPYGACQTCHGLGTESLFSEKVCLECNGQRLRKESLAVTVNGKNIVETVGMNIADAFEFFNNLGSHSTSSGSKRHKGLTETEFEIAFPVLREVTARIKFMLDVGLEYLTLDRRAGTLSGGEAQRIRLASQLGSRLTGTLYVLDEPTIGLHQRDNERLIATLKDLRDLGNTVIVVEHDTDTILASDHMVELGPGAGKHGGHIVIEGAIKDVLAAKPGKSLTIDYLTNKKKIPLADERRTKKKGAIKIIGATENNLKNLTVEIPLGRMVVVTGVSGSGKSTLVNDIVYKKLANKFNGARHRVGKHKDMIGVEDVDGVVDVDQSPIGRTPRSNPATYTGVFSHIRDLFAELPDAKVHGYKPGRFSFNVPTKRGGGRCEHCEGNGMIAIEMHFLPTVYVKCDVCKGRRFDRETLDVLYNGKSIYDVLSMTVEDAAIFFRDIPHVNDRMRVMSEVGLGYLELGQSATTLSGGEAQRVKLSAELAGRRRGKILYILDEPTVGLHFEDVRRLIEVLDRLVQQGNTVLIIEHNLDVIKCADYIVDLGPEGGTGGGTLVAHGTPEDIARSAKSHTGRYLKEVLKS